MKFKKLSSFITLLGFSFGIMAQNAGPAKYSRSSINIHFKIKDDHIKITDTLKLAYYDYVLSTIHFFPINVIVATQDASGNYHFKLSNIRKPVYFNIFKDYPDRNLNENMLDLYLAEPGDSVQIDIVGKVRQIYELPIRFSATPLGYQFAFSGKGAGKYKCRYETEFAIYRYVSDKRISSIEETMSENSLFDSSHLISNTILKRFRRYITKEAYEILKVDLFSAIESCRLEILMNLMYMTSSSPSDSSFLKNELMVYARRIERTEMSFTDRSRAFSKNYFQFVLDRLSIPGNSKNLNDNEIYNVYNKIKRIKAGELKDKVLILFTLGVNGYSRFGQDILDDALLNITTPYLKKELCSYSNLNSIGGPAYNFSLIDTAGKTISLMDFKGKIVFLDFWFTGCYSCITYYKNTLSKVVQRFKNNPAIVFISINIDSRKEDWVKAIYSGNYTSLEAINLNTGGSGANHPVMKNNGVFGYPTQILVGRNSEILNRNSSELRSKGVDELSKLLERAIAGNNNPDR